MTLEQSHNAVFRLCDFSFKRFYYRVLHSFRKCFKFMRKLLNAKLTEVSWTNAFAVNEAVIICLLDVIVNT